MVPDTWTANGEGSFYEQGLCPHDNSCIGCFSRLAASDSRTESTDRPSDDAVKTIGLLCSVLRDMLEDSLCRRNEFLKMLLDSSTLCDL